VIDWSVNIGHVLTIIVLGASSFGFVYTLRSQVHALAERMLEVEEQVKKLVEVLVQQGRHEERLLAMDQRLIMQGQRIDDLARRFNGGQLFGQYLGKSQT
jgi:hypothetical protein